MSSSYTIRTMQPEDCRAVAALICLSTSHWYECNFGVRRFVGGPRTTEIYFEVYHSLPGSSGIVAVDNYSGTVIGSCFQHIRPTHMSLGIMNTHPSYAGKGIASAMMKNICETADREGKDLHLVSSAMNLDSFSLYNRYGFVPFCLYQDMRFEVPEDGFKLPLEASKRVRKATLDDLAEIIALEKKITGLERPGDYEHFLKNPEGIWSVTVCESACGNTLDAAICSVFCPATNIIGPGCAIDEESAKAALLQELNNYPGKTPLVLVPCESLGIREFAYSLGAKNTELHFAQSRGAIPSFNGLTFPTFLPETL